MGVYSDIAFTGENNGEHVRTTTTHVSYERPVECMFQLKWLWRNAKGFHGRFVIGIVMSVLTNVFMLVNPKISQLLVDRVIVDGQKGLLLPLLGVLLGTTVVRISMRLVLIACMERSSQGTLYNIRSHLFKQLTNLDMYFYDRNATGDLMTRFTGDMDMCRHTMSYVLYAICDSVVLFLAAIVYLLTVNWLFTLIMLIITPGMFFLSRSFIKNVRSLYMTLREKLSALNSTSQENIEGNRVVKAFAREEFEIEKFTEKNEEFRKANEKAGALWLSYWPVIESMAQMLTIVTILCGGLFIINGTLTPGELLAFSGLSFAISNPMRNIGPLLNDLQRFIASANKVIELYYAKPRVENGEEPVVPEAITGDIEFKNVTFAFGQEEDVLSGISFHAKPGQTIAIMGATGSGKTTIINLLTRFYDVTGGEILIDGINVKNLDLYTLRKNVGMATQDVFLFSDTVEGNIAYGNSSMPVPEVEHFAKMASAHRFILKMEEGYDTIVGERGVGLSGGQRQRIALARALAVKAPILVLDDTTSALDLETEKEIQSALNTLDYTCTKIIIAQRISSTEKADCIMVLQDGKITESGTHQELLDKGGYYYDTYLLQTGGARPETIKEELKWGEFCG